MSGLDPKVGAVFDACPPTLRAALMDSYRLLYPDAFEFEGQRALIFSTRSAPAETALKHCIAMALTYHRK